MTPYPEHRETDIVLRDGRTVHIRPARAEDRDRVEDYLLGLSDESRRLRFWSVSLDIGAAAASAVEADHEDHETMLALVGKHVVGGAQYLRDGSSPVAEIGVSVADELQGQGLGSILVGHIAEAARERGIVLLRASVLPENHQMVEVFRRTGFPISILAKPGEVQVDLTTDGGEATIEQYEERQRHAAAAAVATFLRARSVVVIGASRDPRSIGGRVFRNLVLEPFAGVVTPVNPNASSVQGVRAYPSVEDVPGEVELAFLAVPAAVVLEAARQCAIKGVRALVVISAGFAESDATGAARQSELLEICRTSGMRLIGPNCMGIANTDPEVRLHGTFAGVGPKPGRVGFMSQSGALGLAVMNMATTVGTGLSSFVSIGNKADISGNDLLSFWEDDPRTDVILLYLESFGDPRRFARLARRISRTKPIVVVKSGRTSAGRRAAGSHTGALMSGSDAPVQALLHQTGVIRTDTLEEMFDVATLLVSQPVCRGPRVGIVTNAGGLGIQCADTCEARGLQVPELSEETVAELRSFLPEQAGLTNPVDMIASATGPDYERAIRTVAADPSVDSLVVIYIPPVEQDAPEIARHLVQAISAIGGKPVATCFMSARGIPDELRAGPVAIPSFAFPEQAAIALAHSWHLGHWRARPAGQVPRLADLRTDEATAILATALEGGEGWLGAEAVERFLQCYGLRLAPQRVFLTAEEAAAAAAGLGPRVVLKCAGPVHKTDVDGVRLGLSPAEVEAEADAMAARMAERGQPLEGFLVQPMLEGGAEMLVGVSTDPTFGPIVACGAGGVTVELVRDVQVRIAPLTDLDAEDMVRSLATFPLLEGFRGSPRLDVEALVDVLLRVSALADRHAAVVEMDCNPVIVQERGATVVDARVFVRPPEPSTPTEGRAD